MALAHWLLYHGQMRTRARYTASEAKAIRELLAAKVRAGKDEQKKLRGQLRRIHSFYITDFSAGGGFGPLDFDDLVRTGQIKVDGIVEATNHAPLSLLKQSPNESPIRHSPAQAREPAESRAASDETYVVDLCDEILGHTALRQHRFPFLVGDGGQPLPVDAWYRTLNLVVEYRERQHTESVRFFDRRQTVSGVPRGEQRKLYDQRRRDVLPQHGITVIEIEFSDLAYDKRKRLTRNRDRDLAVLQRKLAAFA